MLGAPSESTVSRSRGLPARSLSVMYDPPRRRFPLRQTRSARQVALRRLAERGQCEHAEQGGREDRAGSEEQKLPAPSIHRSRSVRGVLVLTTQESLHLYYCSVRENVILRQAQPSS